MKQGDVLDKKEVNLGGKKFIAFLLVMKSRPFVSKEKGKLYVCPKISPLQKFRKRNNKRDILGEYPKLRR